MVRLAAFLHGWHVGETGQFEIVVEQVIEDVAQLQPAAVGALHRLVTEDRRAGHAGLWRHLLREALLQMRAGQVQHVIGNQALQQAGLDALAAPGGIAREQGGQNALHPELRGGQRRHLHRGIGGPPASVLHFEFQHAAAARGHQAFAHGIACIRPLHAPAGDIEVDLAFVDGGCGVIRSQRGQHDVSRGQRALEVVALRRGQHVLAAQQHGRGRMRGDDALRRCNGRDCGAEVGEHHAGQRRGRMVAEIEYTQAGEGRLFFAHVYGCPYEWCSGALHSTKAACP